MCYFGTPGVYSEKNVAIPCSIVSRLYGTNLVFLLEPRKCNKSFFPLLNILHEMRNASNKRGASSKAAGVITFLPQRALKLAISNAKPRSKVACHSAYENEPDVIASI